MRVEYNCNIEETGPAMVRRRDIILCAVWKSEDEALRGKGEWAFGWKRKGEKGEDQSWKMYMNIGVLNQFL